MVGRTITHYRITEKLGSGSMGVVYKAEDTKLKRTVALKFLSAHAGNRPDHDRFLLEAQAAAVLDHPNICTVYEIDQAEEQTFIAQAYIDGPRVDQRISSHALSVEEAIDIGIQAAHGLQHAHERGIIHRDVKPSNLMLTSTGRVVIMDFGVALVPGSVKLTKTGCTLGTLLYMSPEQANGNEVDHRSDVWSLGALIYEMIAGELPFPGQHQAQVMYSIFTNEPKLPIVPAWRRSLELNRAIAKALAKDPDKRYQHAIKLAADLESLRAQAAPQSLRETKSLEANSASRAVAFAAAQTRVPAPANRRRPRKQAPTALSWAKSWQQVWLWFRAGWRRLPRLMRGVNERPSFSRTPPRKQHAIAVLPFSDLSTGQADPDFSHHITRAISSELARTRQIKVIPPGAIEKYRLGDRATRPFGPTPQVAYLLEGDMRREGGRVRIVAKLINLLDRSPIWAETYHCDLAEFTSGQADVTQQIVGALHGALTLPTPPPPLLPAPEVTDTDELCRKGRRHLSNPAPASLRFAQECFEKAIRQAPDCALAHAGLADAYTFLGCCSGSPSYQVMPRAKEAASRALEIDGKLAEAHASMAMVNAVHEWRWFVAERQFQRALELDPVCAHAYYGYAMFHLLPMGRIGPALQQLQRALDIEPRSILFQTARGVIYVAARKYDGAIQQFRKTLDPGEPYDLGYFYLAWSLSRNRNYHEANGALYELLARSQDTFPGVPLLAEVHARLGDRGKAGEILAELESRFEARDLPTASIAQIYLALGDNEQALNWLRVALEQRCPAAIHMKVDPVYEPLHNEPRFAALVSKLGLGPR